MRRFVDEEIEEEEDGGLGFCLPRVSVEAERRLRPRWSLHRRSVSMSLANLRRSFHYDRLPPVPIHLTVVKLDASRFGIEVQKGATVSELKQAVQGAFRHMPTKGPDMISWWHVWGNFCLSYGDEKLVKDDEFIKDYGIKDGDELHFVRHRSTSYNLIKTQSRKQDQRSKKRVSLRRMTATIWKI
ncbi:hypothetical protein Dimus_010220 [Dionaea muscipula]